MRIRLKVCCIASVDEARLAISYGADALGLVGPMPSGPGPIPLETIAQIAAATPPPIATFLLTSETQPTAIVAQWQQCCTTTIQLTDRVEPEHYAALRAALPGIKLVQVIHVIGPESLTEAKEFGKVADALLLDSGNPALAVKELGGTGRVHDWEVSAAICAAVACPVFLAGGLRPDNITEAVRTVRPFGVDLCSGVRTDGKLAPEKLAAFVQALAGGREERARG
ncbi:MAG: phosphoribosylanthranilate isomerase [Armatimonadetes bacterium]|nr:phosphoribosylanthranilate isomerase [Armatimonadota bacterium]